MIMQKLKFWLFSYRIGPDLPITHIFLFSNRLSRWLCKKKFYHFGKNSNVRPGSYIIETDKVSIGNNVVIRPHTMIFASPDKSVYSLHVCIGDNVLIGSGVHIYVSNHKFDELDKLIIEQGHSPVNPVIIEDDVWIGANAIILPGVTIGQHSVIAAGSIVTKSVPRFTMVAGVPAKVLKKL
ncbi:acyltransferase [Shewanella putrefaciens]|uniref:acyltransferase n=1 Tax=Shewanella putrefaciens TaxID=24 RepID=UPI001E3899A7|nr:acyltransferase [Shewanella putrefaciens]